MADRSVPRDDNGLRFTGKSGSEILENDLGAQNNRIKDLERRVGKVPPAGILVSGFDGVASTRVGSVVVGRGLVVSVSGGVATVKSRFNAFGECVLVAMTSSTDELVDTNNREYYLAPYTQFRMVIHETNINGNDYQFQYLASGTWTDIGMVMTTHGVEAISYHGSWQDIPAPVLAVGMPVIRVKQLNTDPDNDVTLCVVQFWDSVSESGTPEDPVSSGETLPTATEVP